MKRIVRINEAKLTQIISKVIDETYRYDWASSGAEFANPDEVCQKLLELGLKEVEADQITNTDEYSHVLNQDEIKRVITQSGAERLRRGKDVAFWAIYVQYQDGETRCFVSKHNFRNEDEAADNCDKYLLKAGCKNESGANTFMLWVDEGLYCTDSGLAYEYDSGWID